MDATILPVIRQCFQHIPNSDNRSSISPRAFLVSLVTALVTDSRKRSIACIRRQMMADLSATFARSSFWERLSTERLKKALIGIIPKLATKLAHDFGVTSDILSKLGVNGIFLLDSSSITLPHQARLHYRAPRSNVIKSAIKWHLCWNIFSGTSDWFCLSEATVQDRLGFPPFDLLKEALVIFDLGYWDYNLLSDLAEAGCYYLSRVKSNAVIQIEALPFRQQWKYPLGKNIFDINWKKFRGDIIEVLGSINIDDTQTLQTRIIGFWNPTSKVYHWYATNLQVSPKLIYPLYRIRWQLELVFKAGKTSLCLADAPSSNPNIIVSLVLASIVSNLIAQPIATHALKNAQDDVKLAKSVQRATKVFVHIAKDLAEYLISGKRKAVAKLILKIESLITELVDPNHKRRPTSLKRLALMG